MDDEDIKVFIKRIKMQCRLLGYGDHADDIAQEIMLLWTSGKRPHQTVKQAVIDQIRRISGRPGWKTGKHKVKFVSLEQAKQKRKSYEIDVTSKQELLDLFDDLSTTQTQMLLLRVMGYTLLEIGFAYGKGEAWACRKMKKILKGKNYEQ